MILQSVKYIRLSQTRQNQYYPKLRDRP